MPDDQAIGEHDSGIRHPQHQPVVVFLHVPKTAGQTLYAILARQYNQAATAMITDASDPLSPFAEVSRRIPPVLVRGHILYGVHEKLGIDPVYITILREPVSRVVSTYRYIKRSSNHPLHAVVHDRSMSLSAFVESDIDREEVVNGQTRQLAGRLDVDPDNETLVIAKRNLQGLAVVGLTERFDESLILLKRRLHWKMPFYVSKNVAPQEILPESLPTDVRTLLEQRNRLDLELYRFATELFEHNVHLGGIWFQAEVALFRRLNGLARLYLRLSKRREAD
jgi:hypothetical protein